MSVSKNYPAFPVEGSTGRGLTKREWFAGMALQGLLAHASGETPVKAPYEAVKLADAIIEALTAQGEA